MEHIMIKDTKKNPHRISWTYIVSLQLYDNHKVCVSNLGPLHICYSCTIWFLMGFLTEGVGLFFPVLLTTLEHLCSSLNLRAIVYSY